MEFTANLSNLGLLNAGTLTDALLAFPATTEKVQAALREIHVDGMRYEEYVITGYSSDIPGLTSVLPEYADIDELNYLAHRLADLSPAGKATFAAAVQHGEYSGNVQDLINLTYNLRCFTLIPGIQTNEDYGRYLVEHYRDFFLPPAARYYFNYDEYGETTIINEGGMLTAQGYIFDNRTPFQQYYGGQEVPSEFKVFQYPMQARAQNRQPEHSPKKDLHSR